MANDILNKLQAEYAEKRNAVITQSEVAITKLVQEDDNLAKLYTSWKQAELDYIKAKHYNKKASDSLVKKAFDSFSAYLKSKHIDWKDLQPHFQCPKCEDKGIIGGKYCQCFLAKYKQLNSDINEVNPEHNFKTSKHGSLSTKGIGQIYEKLQLWCEHYPDSKIKNINLLGNTGSGKSYLLECIANALLEKGLSVQYTTAFNLNNQSKLYHYQKPNTVDRFLDADVLIIDDLGSEPIINNVTIEYLYTILNERLVHHKATAVSSNLNAQQIIERYGERVYSRLFNKQLSLNILFDGKDNRTGI